MYRIMCRDLLRRPKLGFLEPFLALLFVLDPRGVPLGWQGDAQLLHSTVDQTRFSAHRSAASL